MYAYLFKNFLNPAFERLVKRRRVLAYLEDLQQSQWQSRSDIEKLQWQKLKALLEHAYNNSPYFQNVFRSLGLLPEDIRDYADFQRLPLLTKDSIRKHENEILIRAKGEALKMKYTGGSTGNPLKVYFNRTSHEHRVAVTKRGYGWAGCEDGRKQFLLWGAGDYREGRLQYWKLMLHRLLLRHRYFDCFFFDNERKALCVREMNAYQPEFIIAYPNSLYSLAKYIEENAIDLKFVPRAIITGAEKVFPTQRAVIEKAFKASVFNSYGSREFMLMAMECEMRNGLHLSSENIFFEILDKSGMPVGPGEQGEIVITDLHNYSMPFIRYRIGDVAVRSGDDAPCACGRGLPKISDVSGRLLDLIVLPDGNEVPGEFFVRFIGNKPGIVEFRVEQNSLECLDIKLVTDETFTPAVLAVMQQDLRDVLGTTLLLNIEKVDQLPLTPSGKFRVTVSNLAST
jgi:phenylacetate-CoA ligase